MLETAQRTLPILWAHRSAQIVTVRETMIGQTASGNRWARGLLLIPEGKIVGDVRTIDPFLIIMDLMEDNTPQDKFRGVILMGQMSPARMAMP